MLPEAAHRLRSARPFGVRAEIPCKICGAAAKEFGAVDFYRMCWGGPAPDPYCHGFSGIEVCYFRCPDCDFLFTPFTDEWSVDDFATFIYNDQYIMVDPEYASLRPLADARKVHELLGDLQDLTILDYGSGSGVFAGEMTKLGRGSVREYDPFAHPRKPQGTFKVVTCFEVIEHVANPIETLEEIMSYLDEDGVLIFSQCVQPADIERIRCEWWYIAPRNGHISTYSETTLSLIALRLGVTLWRGDSAYLMSKSRSGPLVAALRDNFTELATAPALTAAPATDGWHGVETSARTAFAWTASQKVSWRRLLVAGENRLRLRVLNEIRPGFVRECTLAVDGAPLPTRIEGDKLVAVAVVDRTAWSDVELRQPPLLSPSANGSDDRRFLGIAVSADPA